MDIKDTESDLKMTTIEKVEEKHEPVVKSNMLNTMDIKDTVSESDSQMSTIEKAEEKQDIEDSTQVKLNRKRKTAAHFFPNNEYEKDDEAEKSQSMSKIAKLSECSPTASSENDSTPCTKPGISNSASASVEEERPKRIRRRTKFLIQSVLDQMEFYFSDSNLSKDRFVKQEMSKNKDGYVAIAIFANFNKLQSLHKDGVSEDILKKAITRSNVLQLSDDGIYVRRVTPFKEISKDETDRRTIYVENLPSKATHGWLRTHFSQCGTVVYVSLPVYKTTRESKGFAFIEFESAEQAAKACSLNNPPPEKIEEKPGRFPKYNKTLNRLQKIVPGTIETENKDNEEIVSDDAKIPDGHLATVEPLKKKKKKKSKKKKPTDSCSEEKIDTSENQTMISDSDNKKKKKKKKKKRLSNDITSVQEDLKTEGHKSEDDCPVFEKDVSDLQTKTRESTESKDPISEEDLNDKIDTSNSESKITEEPNRKKKKRRKKKKNDWLTIDEWKTKENIMEVSENKETVDSTCQANDNPTILPRDIANLSRKERKLLRQQDIRRKKAEREKLLLDGTTPIEGMTGAVVEEPKSSRGTKRSISFSSQGDSEAEDKVVAVKEDGSQVLSILKTKKPKLSKRVEFDLVPETKEYVKAKDVRRRKKVKKDKLHLRVIPKKEWDNLRGEYIKQQKTHMTALKESLRELRQQENAQNAQADTQGRQHVDLQDVFGTKRLKPTQDTKMAHVETMQFIPNVIVQWKCAHETHRDKIRNIVHAMGADIGAQIAYIDAEEEAKTGYIRFKDEISADKFYKESRGSSSISARLLPAEQQQAYWDKANEDRMKRLGRKRKEKGSEKLARKVFERNKDTFKKKPNRIVFNDENEDEEEEDSSKSVQDMGKIAEELAEEPPIRILKPIAVVAPRVVEPSTTQEG